MTSRVLILGAGPIGGTLASTLALAGAVREVVLADDQVPQVAAGKALDVRQACPMAGSDTLVTSTADMVAAGFDVIVVADRGADGREWSDEQGLAILGRALLGTAAPVVFAGAGQGWLQEKAIVELRLPWERTVGSAALALEGAMRAVTALEAGCGAREVSLAIVGRPPHDAHVVWEWANLAGRPAFERLDPAPLRRIDRRLPALWPPAAYAAASAAALVVSALLGGRAMTLSCFCWPPQVNGVCALPVRLGTRGVEEVMMPELGRLRAALGR